MELASRKLVLDQPVDGVARLRILNAERRGALDRFASDDFHEGVHAFREKRPPEWSGGE